MAGLTIKNVNKIYSGGVKAVSDFNIEIEHGEFIVFVGPSGCGKSTMLRMIAGLEDITDGEIILDGQVLNDKAPSDRNISMVFQNYALFGNLSVYENMGFPLIVKHMDRDQIYEKVLVAAETVDMKGELNRKPDQLSGGQKQRVAIGRSIVCSSLVFLMDEPLSNLDAQLRAQTRRELLMLQNKLDATFVYVTHDQVEAMTMADRIVIMNAGVIQQIGTPGEVYNKPNNIFVGGFMGSPGMNFLHGKILGDEFVSKDLELKIPADKLMKLTEYVGKSIVLGIRPEHFVRRAERGSLVNIQIKTIEIIDCHSQILFVVNGIPFRAKLRSSDIDFIVGDKIQLGVKNEQLSFFDETSELRIV